ncbi:hypothetical protein F5883DRAFT_605574 [Diaporthe sp. PMI_573]|nr:hypothetical protein F5883DRAFT_605574 [Diaporthaceae sp. PMI_573]
MPRDRRDEPGESSRAVHGGEREGNHNQHAADSHSHERHDSEKSGGHHDRHRRHRHNHSRDIASSRSPAPVDEDRKKHRHHHHRRHRNKPTTTTAAAAPAGAREPPPPAELPYGARPLSYKHDLDAFTPLFAYYLDVQKSLDFFGLEPQQARGRWKSFVNKWNRGGLAEGWYDPEMFERITREAPPPATRQMSAARDDDDGREGYGAGERGREGERGDSSGSDGPRAPITENGGRRAANNNKNDDSDSDYGPPPPPPGQSSTGGGTRIGPTIPTLSDLSLQRESAAEDRESQYNDLRQARKADRAEQKERLEELAPRAEPGTRERRLEKKAAVNEKMKGFREGGDAGVEEVGDGDLMGGGDSVADLKRAKAAMQRKKTERELRREAEARAREEERLARLKEWKEREEEKLKGLKELARARFG